MKVVVIGAGAVGGYFGGRLAQAGEDVQFLVREARYLQLRERGLRLQSVHGNATIQPNITISPDDAARGAELVVVAVKNYHLKALLPTLDLCVANGADILPLLNGVQHFDILTARYGLDSVLGGTCLIESTMDEGGDVIQSSPMQELIFGPLPANQAHRPGGSKYHRLTAFETALQGAGVTATLSNDIKMDIWTKFLFLSSFSGVTASMRVPIGRVLQDEVARDFTARLLDEGVRVARAREVNLAEDVVDQVVQRLYHLNPSMTSSLHRDLEKGMPLEIDSLQGAWVQMGQEVGVPTPNFDALYAVLHPHRDGHHKA